MSFEGVSLSPQRKNTVCCCKKMVLRRIFSAHKKLLQYNRRDEKIAKSVVSKSVILRNVITVIK
jgi:hypothetical protein